MTMKKLLSLLMAVILTVTPMAVLAENADLGTYENPYLLYADSMTPLPITVAPGTEAYVKVDQCDNSTVTVGHATSDGYFLQYGRQSVYPGADGTAEFTMNAFSDVFSVYNSGETDVVVYLKLAAGALAGAGTMDNPEEILLEKDWFGNLGAFLTKDLDAGNEGYYYSWTATSDGYFTANLSAFDAEYMPVGWLYFLNNVTAGIYGDIHWSDDEIPVNYESVKVSAGDEVVLFVSTYDPNNMWSNPAGSVSVNASFDAIGSMNFPQEITAGEYTAVLEAGNQGYHYTWTAAANGTVSVAMLDESWQYNLNILRADETFVYGDTHWSDDETVVSTESHSVSAGDVVTVMVATYDPADMWNNPAGTLHWSLTFTPGEGEDPVDPPVDVPDEPVTPPTGDGKTEGYFWSDVVLSVGDNECELDPEYMYTVYYFEPTEVGKYTFTAANGYVALVSYNGMWVTIEPSAETVTESTFEWECKDVGQSILVAAISDEPGIFLTIEKEEIVIVEIPWTIYENKFTPVPFSFEGDEDALLYVDTFDGVCDVAVLGVDGYYHLGNANGPLLYACLSDPLMSLAGAMEYGQLKDVIYDGDTVVQKINYNEAFGEYLACTDETAYYPLTEDLMIIFQSVGKYQDWYGEDGWVGGNLDDAWMFACYYFEQEEPAFVFGDVDGDGKAAKTDYFKLKSYLLGKDIAFDDGMFARSDIDGNGKVNKTDYFKLKSYLLGKWTPEN